MNLEFVGGPIDGHALDYPDGDTISISAEGRRFDVPVRIRPDGQRVVLWQELMEMIGTSKP